jgi:hypothetical protein
MLREEQDGCMVQLLDCGLAYCRRMAWHHGFSLMWQWIRSHPSLCAVTEAVRIQFVLVGMRNWTFGPYLAAIHE